MILFAARAAKVILVLAVLFGGWVSFKNKLQQKVLLLLAVLAIFFAFTSNWLAGFLPPLKDEIRLTALGEQNSEGSSSEVYLSGYTIDNKSFVSGESLEIVEGHWFWSGETYAWRPETDSRQPEGVTRTVVLQIPVGWSRTLDFSGSIYRGSVEIDTGNKQWSVDTYSANDTRQSVEIGRSETSKLIWNQIRYLAVYAVIFLICAVSTYFVVVNALRKPKQARSWLEVNSGKIIYGGISIFILVLMICFADKYSLWIDELWEIYFVKGTLQEALQYCIDMSDIWPPFFTLSASLWYHVAPYGQRWLLLIAIIPSAFSIYLTGRIGEKLHGRTCGILAALFMGFSTTLWLNAAYEFRAYAFLTTCSTIALYCYIRRNESNRKRWIGLFSLSLTALAMSHYFGMLCCAVFFLSDVFLLWKKRIQLKVGVSYLLPGIASIVWLGIVYVNTLQQLQGSVSSASPALTFSSIASLLRFLTGNFEPVYFILLTGLIIFIFNLYKLNGNLFSWPEYHDAFLAATIVFVISFVFILGNFINTALTLSYERYYMVLLPHVCVLSALTVHNLCMFIGQLQKREYISKNALCTVIGVILCMNCLAVILNPSAVSSLSGHGTSTTMPFREAADWIYTQSNYIFNEDTVIISTQGDEIPVAWDEYYITRQGRRDGLNQISMWDTIAAEDVLQYKRIYVNCNWRWIPASLRDILNMYYILETDRSDIGVQVYVFHK